MKKFLFLIGLPFFLSACSTNQPSIEQSSVSQNNAQTYQEVKADLTDDVSDMFGDHKIGEKRQRLAKKGFVFWHDGQKQIPYRKDAKKLLAKKNCGKHSPSCHTNGIQVTKNHIPQGFKTKECLPEKPSGTELCDIIFPEFPQKAADQMDASAVFYGVDTDVYSAGKTGHKNIYTVFKNNEKIFSAPMFWGSSPSPISDMSLINDEPAFTFTLLTDDFEPEKIGNKLPSFVQNIFYNGETMNEKYAVRSSRKPFSYDGKIGFVAAENDKDFIFFNGQKVSGDFDKMITHACCAIIPYPFELYENGILFFLAKRGEDFYFVEVNLNNYL